MIIPLKSIECWKSGDLLRIVHTENSNKYDSVMIFFFFFRYWGVENPIIIYENKLHPQRVTVVRNYVWPHYWPILLLKRRGLYRYSLWKKIVLLIHPTALLYSYNPPYSTILFVVHCVSPIWWILYMEAYYNVADRS